MIIHPDELLALKEELWPHVTFYQRQVEVIDSVLMNDETYVPAGNKLGKDFVAAFIALSSFIACKHLGISCRIVTTSVAEHHLKVLWGEVGRFLTTSRVPLLAERGGEFIVNYQEVRRREEAEAKNPTNYLIGRVSERGEGLSGHHAQFGLIIGDEASGLDDKVYEFAQGWATSMLWIGNPNVCDNFFKRGVKGGNVIADRPSRILVAS